MGSTQSYLMETLNEYKDSAIGSVCDYIDYYYVRRSVDDRELFLELETISDSHIIIQDESYDIDNMLKIKKKGLDEKVYCEYLEKLIIRLIENRFDIVNDENIRQNIKKVLEEYSQLTTYTNVKLYNKALCKLSHILGYTETKNIYPTIVDK